MARRGHDPGGFETTLAQLRQLLAGSSASPAQPQDPNRAPLALIPASVAGTQGGAIRMVPIDGVIYFEAADKCVRVLTSGHEYLIRTPLKHLLPQLDTQQFWQVHHGTVVRFSAIDRFDQTR